MLYIFNNCAILKTAYYLMILL